MALAVVRLGGGNLRLRWLTMKIDRVDEYVWEMNSGEESKSQISDAVLIARLGPA
jgi:hypothetical protein